MTQNLLAEFRRDRPEGRIETSIINCKNGELIVKAEVYAGREDAKPIATSHAYEKDAEVEICELKAVDRALAIAGYQGNGGEPAKVETTVTEKPNPAQDDPGSYVVKWRNFEGAIKDLPPKKLLWLAANYTGRDDHAKQAAKKYLALHPELLGQVGKTA